MSKETVHAYFLRATKDTARARFKARKRLADLDRRLTRIVSLSTAYIIVLTIAPYIIKGPTYVADTLNFFTIFLSIIILVGSLLQYSGQYALDSELMHRSALEINEIRRKIQLCSPTDNVELDRLITEYNAILLKYSINHVDMDYHAAIVESSQDYSWVDERKLRKYRWEMFWHNFQTSSMFWIVSVVFVGLLSFAYYYRTPHS